MLNPLVPCLSCPRSKEGGTLPVLTQKPSRRDLLMHAQRATDIPFMSMP